MFHLINNGRSFLSMCLIGLLIVFCACKKTARQEVKQETGTVVDVQGNVYATVKIGNQWWMAENLKVKWYNDSTLIVEVKSTDADSLWANKNVGAFCNIDGRYGLHYNWFAVSNNKKIAPAGWHIPSDEEWKTLEKELGMSGTEADKTSWRGSTESEKLIPTSSIGWPTNSAVFGTNESGFSALPGGCKVFNGVVGDLAGAAYWWSSSEKNSTAWYRNVSSDHPTIFRYYADKHYGLTIRCVKD